MYDYKELKQILYDINADKRTRIIAHKMAKSSIKVACLYASKYPLRVAAEREIKRSYET